MEKIASFTINHTKLLRGIYVSRKDKIAGGGIVTTFDIRMKRPNREPAISQPALHTIEHLAATFLRNNPEWSDKIVYWGPMGCCTGNYFLVQGDLQPQDILQLMTDTFKFISEYDGEIPGATANDCGNYMLHNLPMAKWEAKKYLVEVLENMTEANMHYPE
ncbi:MAG: S-ribosylhomocysteine lyase [Sodaliphilus sp.]|nr:S-ribosylhomocysteine lyase [Sodaliphilus sp.]